MRSLTKSKILIVIPLAFNFFKSVHATDSSPLAQLEDQLLEVEQLFSWVINPDTSSNEDTLINIDGLPEDAVVLDNQDGSTTLVWMPDETDIGEHEIVIHLANFNAAAVTSERSVRLNVATREEYRALRATQLTAKTAAAANAFSQKHAKESDTSVSSATISSASLAPAADEIAGDLIEELFDQGVDQAALSSSSNDSNTSAVKQTDAAVGSELEATLATTKNKQHANSAQSSTDANPDLNKDTAVAGTTSDLDGSATVEKIASTAIANTHTSDSVADTQSLENATQATEESTPTELAAADSTAGEKPASPAIVQDTSDTVAEADDNTPLNLDKSSSESLNSELAATSDISTEAPINQIADAEEEEDNNDLTQLATNSGSDTPIQTVTPGNEEPKINDDSTLALGTLSDSKTLEPGIDMVEPEAADDTITLAGASLSADTTGVETSATTESLKNPPIVETEESVVEVDQAIAQTNAPRSDNEADAQVDTEITASTEPETVPIESIKNQDSDNTLSASEQITIDASSATDDKPVRVSNSFTNNEDADTSDQKLLTGSTDDKYSQDSTLALLKTPDAVELSGPTDSGSDDLTEAPADDTVVTAELRVNEELVFAAGHSQEKSISIVSNATEPLVIKALNTPAGAEVKSVGQDAYSLIWKPNRSDKGQRILILQIRDQQDSVITARRVKLIVE